ncbi:16S rRNA (guanine(527)-N(7))-methyltransferase RsmG [Magnetofaba australis]|uniref:Ribosomal RNA small subunit methyltransferase G n=1 Tax=Magnetofaba australis IT-1 TaxID=1434232 RepID=A0A1Y2K2A8_9PROT|nr:16S rRNA (guanine(527)-N(7))-methyltransferase RsmG [Magnetofaba australis]OSM00461.1 putative methyltransferase GidB [Magnetofaba australis IT-1]
MASETQQKLDTYISLLQEWNKSFNLIGRSTENEIRTRHIEESIFVAEHLGEAEEIVDFGSGAGIPGIVIAIIRSQNSQVTLIEKDKNKCTFLNYCKKKLDLENVIIEEKNLKNDSEERFDVVVSRATASIEDLVEIGGILLKPSGKLILLVSEQQVNDYIKGSEREINQAQIKQKKIAGRVCTVLMLEGDR